MTLNLANTDNFATGVNLSNGNDVVANSLSVIEENRIVNIRDLIGAILLTFRRRTNMKRQDMVKQSSRERVDSISSVDAEINKGVKIND